MKFQQYLILISLILSLTLFGISCSGGGGGGESGDGEGLEIAEQIAFVTAKESSSDANLIKSAVPASGDIITDNDLVERYVFDESMEILDEINMILCFVGQTRYADLCNKEPYTALVDVSLCDRKTDKGSESSDRSSAETHEYETWTVECSRTGSDPQIVDMWIELPEDHFTGEINTRMTISEAMSDTNPFGTFTANYKEVVEGGGEYTGNLSCATNSEGLVECGLIDGSGFNWVHVLMSPDGESGNASVQFIECGPECGGDSTSEYEGKASALEAPEGFGGLRTVNTAFNSDYYLVEFDEPDKETRTECRSRNDYYENIWSYNLYDSTGSRVERNSGMGIKLGEHEYGWAGYYGVWHPDEIDLANGDEVTNDDGTETYTYIEGNSRLIERTRNLLTLNEVTGDTFYMWNDELEINELVRWDGTNLIKFGAEECNEEGCTVTETDEEIVECEEPHEWKGMWKEGLGFVDLVCPADMVLDGNNEVPYYAEEFVLPGSDLLASGDLTLQCYFECPPASITDCNNPFLPNAEEDGATPYLYTFNANTFTLSYEGEEVTWDAGNCEGTSHDWGLMTGAMVPQSVSVEPYEIWEQETTYAVEIGPNDWNKMTALIDSDGNAVNFDPPLQCLYTDDTYGAFRLDYEGAGNLYGIPFEEIVPENNPEFSHWVAKFSIPDNAELTCDGDPYYTKQMIIEQFMRDEDVAVCTGVLTAEDIGAPDNEYVEPDIGDKPTVTGKPKVVGGVLE